MSEVQTYREQYGKDGYDITGQGYAEDDANTVTLWSGAHGDTVIVSCERTPRGLWRIAMTDGWLPLSAYNRVRFRDVNHVLEYIGKKWDMTFTEAVCRCGTAENCD